LVKRKGRLIFFVAAAVLAAVSLVIYMNVHRAPEKRKHNGLYNWNSVVTQAELEELLQVAERVSVGEIYQYYREEELQDRVPEEMVSRLSEKGIRVWYVTGAPEWGIDETGEEIRRAVSMLALYNRMVPGKARFAGIQLDVEPYLTDLWAEDKQRVMELWYKALYRGKVLAEAYDIPVMICVPRWMDAVNKDIFEKMLHECCDEVAIMNYDRRDESEGIQPEMELALQYQRPVICVSELTQPGKHELTDEHTYYHAGLSQLHESWRQLSQDYPHNDLRFAYHHMSPLKEMLNCRGKQENN
jgi:hypothetical protein